MQAPTENAPVTEAIAPVATATKADASVAERLVRARLGPYAGLYYALRAKHPPAAAHCLRVAIGCSKWGAFCNLPSNQRDIVELAGLLHDIGKIGIPDRVLQKPEALSQQEQSSMAMTLEIGIEMLAAVGASRELLEVIAQARLPYANSSRLQLASMLKIVDAYDAMTTAQVFRAALSREHAVSELCKTAGTQFDPDLVRNFAELVFQPRPELEQEVAKRWLMELSPEANSNFSGMVSTGTRAVDKMIDSLFHHRLLESLPEAAIYLDSQGKILSWNRAAETLSGRAASAALHCSWSPNMIGLTNDDGSPITLTTCPLQQSLKTSSKHSVSMKLTHAGGKTIQVELSAIPLFTSTRALAGFVILIRDESRESDLVKRVQTLHTIATQDPLTKVANRAELNRRLEEFVVEHSATGSAGSVIMCDIDFFKRINDNYSHQAGDEALITFAALLRESARKEDLVARYGGEEFVILCEGCDMGSAHARAEQLRKNIEQTPIPALEGKTMTSSFGVTELQPGDDADTLLARADRALMTAKETGRNRVVQLGAGSSWNRAEKSIAPSSEVEAKRSSWLSWFTGNNEAIEVREFLSAVPFDVAVQKLEGFVGDHRAEVLSTKENEVSIRVMGGQGRRGEHRIAMILNVQFQDVKFCTARTKVYQNRTKFNVSIHPVKPRDRRQTVIAGQAHQIMLSFQAYIVGQEIDDELAKAIILPR